VRIILLGNAGSGKTTLARSLMRRHAAARLSLDTVAFDGGTQRRPLEESIAAVERFIADHASWIIEGCYADIIEPLLPRCESLIFLNPGVEVCIAHCRARPWESEKFGSSQAQAEHLEHLIAWVRDYACRDDEYGLGRHRALYESFRGRKCELAHPDRYEAEVEAMGIAAGDREQ
jgi:adenylate kinase family enzyme